VREVFLIQVAGWAVATNEIDMLSDAGYAEHLPTSVTKLRIFREVTADLTPI